MANPVRGVPKLDRAWRIEANAPACGVDRVCGLRFCGVFMGYWVANGLALAWWGHAGCFCNVFSLLFSM